MRAMEVKSGTLRPSGARTPTRVGSERTAAGFGRSDGLFYGFAPVGFSTLTNQSLTLPYEAVWGGLAADDAAEEQGKEPPFKIRDTAAWMKHVAGLEAEMAKLGMVFELIAWDAADCDLTKTGPNGSVRLPSLSCSFFESGTRPASHRRRLGSNRQ